MANLSFRSAMLLIFACLVVAGSSGCTSLVGPDWFNPGSIREQRLRALVNDPYPDTHAGPEVVGGRPREFSESLPEPVKNRPNYYAPPPIRF